MSGRLRPADDPASIEEGARLLREGGLVAFPTETVYGLGANAFDAAAVARVFEVKARPSFDPLIVHLAAAADLDRVSTSDDPRVQRLAARFWPGPLTLVLPRRPELPEIVTAGLDTVGVRVPGHAAARELIRRAGTPVAAPSANPFGYVSPTTAGHVAELLGRRGGPDPRRRPLPRGPRVVDRGSGERDTHASQAGGRGPRRDRGGPGSPRLPKPLRPPSGPSLPDSLRATIPPGRLCASCPGRQAPVLLTPAHGWASSRGGTHRAGRATPPWRSWRRTARQGQQPPGSLRRCAASTPWASTRSSPSLAMRAGSASRSWTGSGGVRAEADLRQAPLRTPSTTSRSHRSTLAGRDVKRRVTEPPGATDTTLA